MTSADLKLLAKEIKSGMFATISYNTAEQEKIKTITARAENLNYTPYYDWAKQKLMWQSVSISL